MSVILFGSAATGGFSETVSVDLILVFPDGASAGDRRRLRDDVTRLEILHGLREAPARPPGALEAFVERVTSNATRVRFVANTHSEAQVVSKIDPTPSSRAAHR